MKANLFKIKDLKNFPIIKSIIKKNIKNLKKHSYDLVLRHIIREIIDKMVKDIISNTKKNIKRHNIKNSKDFIKAQYPIVSFSTEMRSFDLQIKMFLKKKMYFHDSVKKRTDFGKKIVKSLFFKIKQNPQKYINKNYKKHLKIERSICDFIAGMTDRYAINLYNKIK